MKVMDITQLQKCPANLILDLTNLSKFRILICVRPTYNQNGESL